MHTDEWDKVFEELKAELGKDPTVREVQNRLYQNHFGKCSIEYEVIILTVLAFIVML